MNDQAKFFQQPEAFIGEPKPGDIPPPSEKAMRAWYVGLHCRQCGTLVKQNDGGTFWMHVTRWGQGPAEAECRKCREEQP